MHLTQELCDRRSLITVLLEIRERCDIREKMRDEHLRLHIERHDVRHPTRR
jgi:hypothetical protein